MADTVLILTLPSFRSLWLFPIWILSFSPNCGLHWWAFQDLVWPFTIRLLINTPKASWMKCNMLGMRFFNADHWILEASRVDCNSRGIEYFEEALSVVIPSKWPSVGSKRSRTSFTWSASCASVYWVFILTSLIRFRTWKPIGYQPHHKQGVLRTILKLDPYSKQ